MKFHFSDIDNRIPFHCESCPQLPVPANFGPAWEAIGEDKEVKATIALGDASSMINGVRTLVNFVAMHPLGR